MIQIFILACIIPLLLVVGAAWFSATCYLCAGMVDILRWFGFFNPNAPRSSEFVESAGMATLFILATALQVGACLSAVGIAYVALGAS